MKAGYKYATPAILAACVLLGACGKIGDLEPRTANGGPPKAHGQAEPQTAEKLITPAAQARPGRNNELLKRSKKRDYDSFDLPPGYEPPDESEAQPTLLEQSEIP